MRNLTFIALKLLGILSIYWAVSDLGYIGMSMTTILRAGPPPFPALGWILAIWFLLLVIVAAFPFILLARTGWIVPKLNLPAEPSPAIARMEPSQLLRTGLILVGAFTVIDAIPSIVSTVSMYLANSSPSGKSAFTYDAWRIIPPVLKLLLGWIVIGRSQRFAQMVFPPRPGRGRLNDGFHGYSPIRAHP
jgi:hypothetical protein